MQKTATWLRKSLDYQFQNIQLLERALTHRSALGINNERLEFLGDAILNFVVSEAVYLQRPDATEGMLSRLRSSQVKDTMLAEVATAIGVGDHLILGPGEKKSGGYRRTSILADALEAIFGAIYLDSGFDEARRVIHLAFGGRLDKIPDSAARRDPKTRLQELVQSRRIALPEYRVDKVDGEAHRQVFSVTCIIEELGASATGQGTTRRDAEQESARQMLMMLESTG